MPDNIKRNPVIQEAIEKSHLSGVVSPGYHTGPVDKEKTRLARKATGVSTNLRNAGMMLDYAGPQATWGASSTDAFHTSYATGNIMYGQRDIPTYFVMMNQQNGGVLYWPASLRERYEWFRYFARTDAYVGRALELLSDLPMSKITFDMPKMENKKLQDDIYLFYEDMCDKINLFQKLQEILWDYNCIGNVFCFAEYNEEKKAWSKLVILPPEEVNCFTYPFSDNARIEYRPERLMEIVKSATEQGKYTQLDDQTKELLDNIPDDVINMIKENDCIVMDSNPMEGGKPGSFTYHFARRRSPYLDLGSSVLERVLVPMLQKENYRYTQLALATRNMTPKNKVSAPGLTQPELDDLREQLDLSYMDPDYTIVTNYEWEWEQIGADGRLLDLTSEYEAIENQVFAGLGVTRELLTGEGTYAGNRITIEILNTVFLLTREMLTSYVEKVLFQPIAEAHGWYAENDMGIKEYWYPRLSFNRLSIRDNQEIFDNLFQLYQKGSLPIDIIYELLNLNSDNIAEMMKDDLFTIKDPTFNRTIENVNDEVGRALVERSDIVEKVGKYLDLKVKPPLEEGGEGEFGGGFSGEEDFGEGTPELMEEITEEVKEMEPNEAALQDVADKITENLPSDISRDDVKKIVKKLDKDENQ